MLENIVEIMPPSPLKILATPLSAVYQNFSNEGSNFLAKLQEKTPRIVTQYREFCDSIIPLHFCWLFANYYL